MAQKEKNMKFYYNPTTYKIYEHCFYDEDNEHSDYPFFDMTFEDWCEKMQSHQTNQAPYFENGEIVLKEEEVQLSNDDKIMELLSWFDKYDMQVKQAERSIRLGEKIDIHIDGKVYQSIKELDSEANEKAKDLKILRQK